VEDPESDGPDEHEEEDEGDNFLDEPDDIPEDNFVVNTVILTPRKSEMNNSFENSRPI